MVDINQLNADIVRGNQYYSNLVADILQDKSYGIKDCIEEKPLYNILLALQFELLQDEPNDDVLQNLQNCLIKIIGESDDTNYATVYYGFLDTKTILSPSNIILGTGVQIESQLEYTLNLNDSLDYKYVWIAEPLTEPLKGQWKDTVNNLNKGYIGTDQDLFNTPTTSGSFRVYITEYKTIFANPILFTISTESTD